MRDNMLIAHISDLIQILFWLDMLLPEWSEVNWPTNETNIHIKSVLLDSKQHSCNFRHTCNANSIEENDFYMQRINRRFKWISLVWERAMAEIYFFFRIKSQFFLP